MFKVYILVCFVSSLTTLAIAHNKLIMSGQGFKSPWWDKITICVLATILISYFSNIHLELPKAPSVFISVITLIITISLFIVKNAVTDAQFNPKEYNVETMREDSLYKIDVRHPLIYNIIFYGWLLILIL
jgi:hypothetical protein